MKYPIYQKCAIGTSRTPLGVRGLKYSLSLQKRGRIPSHPARGAWIEMVLNGIGLTITLVAPRSGCVD